MAILYLGSAHRDPRNHPRRIYISCSCEDLHLLPFFEEHIKAIESDCLIGYRDPDAPVEDIHWLEVADFHLVMVPITANWFVDGVHQREFELLTQQKKTLIPILFDEAMEPAFNEKAVNAHFLKETDAEFDEKLRRALHGILLESDVWEQAQEGFTHKMFIAYCREDRERVEELIRRVHAEELGKRISIWFDKYLPTGRNFEDSIFCELDDCQLFVVTLTPQLVNRDNYVKQHEYPRALEKKKKIVFFEMEDTDWDVVLEQLADASEQHRVTMAENVGVTVRKILQHVPGKNLSMSGSQRDYLLGLAYQNGIGSEFDYDYARKKFESAAHAGNTKAMHRLGDMYFYGIGVPRDHKKAIRWYHKELKQAIAQYETAEKAVLAQLAKIATSDNPSAQELYRGVRELFDQFGNVFLIGTENARFLRDEGYAEEAGKLYAKTEQTQTRLEKVKEKLVGNDQKLPYHPGIRAEQMEHELTINRNISLEKSRLEWEKALDSYRRGATSKEVSCGAVVAMGRLYGLALVMDEKLDQAAEVMQQALEAAEQALDYDEVYEKAILLYRDLGQVYYNLADSDASRRKAYANRALEMYDVAFKRGLACSEKNSDNFYLKFMCPNIYVLKSNVYALLDDCEEAGSWRAHALAFALGLEKKLGKKLYEKDFAICYLQLYAVIAQGLPIIGEIKTMYQEIVERFSSIRYQGDHKQKAQEYLKTITEALNAQ